MPQRKQHHPEFNAKVTPAAFKDDEMVCALASGSRAHPAMIHQCKPASFVSA